MSLELPEDLLLPDYAGSTLANVPATVAALLGVPLQGLPPLYEPLWRPVGSGLKRVVVLLLDSLGWNIVQALQPELEPLLEEVTLFDRITSIFPSTTVAALTSLWTGYAPAQHGLVGLRLFFPEQAVLGQMLRFSPNFASFPDSLIDAGVSPEHFLPVPGFAEQLAAAGIPSYSFKNYGIIDSALSRMHDRGVAESYGIETFADLLVQIRSLLESSAGRPLYAYGYWSSIDTLSHIRGYDHPSIVAEVRSLVYQIRSELLDQLSLAARRDTLLCILADHGQVISSAADHVYLDEHPELMRCLLMRPAGEPRTAYFYARQEKQRDLYAYLQEHLYPELAAIPSTRAVEAGLLGPKPHSPETLLRLGDVLVTMRHNHLFLTPDERENAGGMPGRHGGMTAAEMVIPWMLLRLDG
jgi:predicted AlkP superfamily pyrophosphatase or phosphodiesterase